MLRPLGAPMRFHFIVNPVAGRRRMTALLDEAQAMLREHGFEVDTYVTRCAGDAGAHVAALGPDEVDRIVVVGGDGTLREVVNGRPPPLPWPIGLVPVGTANLVARELGMPLTLTPRAVAEALRAANPWTVDLLRLERPGAKPAYAVANVGVGLDAGIVHAIDGVRAKAAGSGGYVRWIRPIFDAFRSFRFPTMAVTVDERRTFRASSCVIQNAYNYGGLFHLAPDARLDSRQCNVMLLRCRSSRDLFRVMLGAFRKRADRYHDVRFEAGTRVRLQTAERAPVQADGDPAGHTDVTVTLLPGALRLLRVGRGDPETNGDGPAN